jgi:hypothetical protein
MAQTIATVRGTASLSGTGRITLFTQSGGNSTRVILNQVTWYVNSSASTSYGGVAQLLHQSSSGPVSIIGYHNDSNRGYSLTYPAFQMMPNPNGTGPIQGGGYTGAGSISGVITSGDPVGSPDWIGSRPANYVNITTNGNVYSYMPQNYWIGSGDSIVFNIYTAVYGATVGYHFTTITES